MGNRLRLINSNDKLIYDEDTGRILGMQPDARVPASVFSVNVGVFPSLASLALEPASKYPLNATAYVGPDAYGQYAEWFSNGVRWRPRGGLLMVKNTPASLPDTTSTETDIWQFTIPAPLLGPNDIVSANYFWSYTNNATNKTFRIYFGGQAWLDLTSNAGAGFRGSNRAVMRNSNSVQMWPSSLHGVAYADGSGSSGGAVIRNIDTTQDVIVKAAARWASGGGGANNITLEYIALRLEFEA